MSQSLQSGKGRRGAILTKLVLGMVLAAGGVGTVAVVGQSGKSDRQSQRAASRAAEHATAQKTSFDITVTATGDLQAKNQIEVRSELETETSIVELAPEGKMVKKGDLLIRLNADQIQTQLDDAKLQVEAAKANQVAAENSYMIQQSENESKLRQAKLKLDLAILDLDQWEKGERVQKLKDIELALDKNTKDFARLEERYGRSQELFKQGFQSKDELQRDEIALREARAALEKAKLEQLTYTNFQEPKDRKTKESAVEEARAELERVRQQNEIELASKEATRFNARTTRQLREERMNKLVKQLAATEMRAPQDGLVIYATNAGRGFFGDDSPMQVGRRVRPQEALIVLPDTSEMVASVRVPEAIAGRIRRGQPATVKVDKLPGMTFTGQVDEIGILAESQDRWRDPNRREYTVKVLLDDPKSAGEVELKPSDRSEATIVLGRVQDAIAVPLQAVFTEEQVPFVWTPAGSRYERTPVRVARRSDTLAEIAVGLSEGMQVLLREPTAGEKAGSPWVEDQLKQVGFKIGDSGKPERIGGAAGPGGPGGRPDGPPRRRPGGGPPGGAPGGGPAGEQPGGGSAKAPAAPGATTTATAAPAGAPASATPANTTPASTTTPAAPAK